jgi:cytochrome c peroxidase
VRAITALLLLLCLGATLLSAPRAQQLQLSIPSGLIEPDIPLSSPFTSGAVNLGRRLFFDQRLSLDGKTSCGTCHDPRSAFADRRRLPVDAAGRIARRNSQGIANSGYLPTLSWDGRHKSLESQALDSFTEWGDMAIPIDVALNRVGGDVRYTRMFEDAFGVSQPSVATVATALASYQRSLLSGDSRFDRFMFGGDPSALTATERRGLELFVGSAGCINCHDVFHKSVNPLGGAVALFTDFRFHNLGVGYEKGRMRDVGRYQVTRDPADWGSFRTPSLRNVDLTAPYMHDGSIATLEEVIDFYDRGGNDNPNKATGLTPLLLDDADKLRLRAFLAALTSKEFENSVSATESCGRAGPVVVLPTQLCR